MGTRRLIQREMAVAALLLATGGGAAAAEQVLVTKLRTDHVSLYDCNGPKKKPDREYDRAAFKGPWRATEDESMPLFLRVRVDGKEYCVRKFAVETDKAVTVKKDSQCGAVVAQQQQKSGATRGLGEGCGQ
ncbi:MAG TPA: hypothetical protein VEL75_21850 [Candidatus Methylomirabilis sp.]|nr:hypothetical protein [Candidatus Methylomirabilis sp.]